MGLDPQAIASREYAAIRPCQHLPQAAWKQDDEQDQKDNNKPIPLVPGLKYRNFIVISVHLKSQSTNHKSQKKVKNQNEK